MELFDDEINRKLAEAGPEGDEAICKIFNPYGPGTWILFGQDSDNPEILWCVADLGMGCVEYGTVSRSELEQTRVPPLGLGLERDLSFEHAGKPVEFFITKESLAGI